MDLSFPDEAQSVVAIVESQGSIRYLVFEPSESFRTEVEDGNATMTFIAYPFSPASLDLQIGSFEPSRCGMSCQLLEPSPSATFRVSLSEEVSLPALVPRLEDRYADLLVPDRDRCSSCPIFETLAVETGLGTQVEVTFAADWPGRGALIGFKSGELVRIGDDLEIEQLCSTGLQIERGALVPPSALTLVSENRFVTLDVSDASCALTSSVSAGVLGTPGVAIAGGPTQSGFEVFAMTGGGIFGRFDGNEVKILGDAGIGLAPDATGSVAWLGEGRAFGAARGTSLMVYDHGRTTLEPVPAVDPSSIDLVGVTSRGQRITSLRDSRILVETEQGWSHVVLPFFWKAGGLSPYRSGFLATVNNGQFVYAPSPETLCPPQSGLTKEKVYRLSRLGKDATVFGDIYSNSSHVSEVGVVRPPALVCR
ncbi:MAG: hypothetical protein HYV07_07275 [Deltaproteobacteria bacterium]|nr:hypothetical protein [Deltaproteobacteria bacterium]